jgi:hypothetical protein
VRAGHRVEEHLPELGAGVTGIVFWLSRLQEVLTNSQNVALQEKFHRRISKGATNISGTLENNGIKFLL